jgi:hypothetical protein
VHLPKGRPGGRIDTHDLTAVVDVLIDNVFAHTDEGVPLEVSVMITPQRFVALLVEDGGPACRARTSSPAAAAAAGPAAWASTSCAGPRSRPAARWSSGARGSAAPPWACCSRPPRTRSAPSGFSPERPAPRPQARPAAPVAHRAAGDPEVPGLGLSAAQATEHRIPSFFAT